MLDSALQFITGLSHGLVWDALVVAVIFAGSVVFAFTLGRNSIIVSFVAIVFAGLVVHLLPSLSFIPYLNVYPESQLDVGTFMVASLLFGIIFRRNRFFEPYVVPTGLERFVFAGALAGLIVVLLGSFWSEGIITPYVQQLFIAPWAQLAWLFAPVLLLAIFRGDNA